MQTTYSYSLGRFFFFTMATGSLFACIFCFSKSFGFTNIFEISILTAVGTTCFLLFRRGQFLFGILAVILFLLLSSVSGVPPRSKTLNLTLELVDQIPSDVRGVSEVEFYLNKRSKLDDWLNPIYVEVLDETTLEVKSLGRDNEVGGKGVDSDIIVRIDSNGNIINEYLIDFLEEKMIQNDKNPR